MQPVVLRQRQRGLGVTALRPRARAVMLVALTLLSAYGYTALRHGAMAADGNPPEPTDPVGRFAFVTNQGSETVSVVDLGAASVVVSIPVPGKPAGVALSPDRRRVYVSVPEAKDIAVIDAEKREVVGRVPVGSGPLGIAVNPRSGEVLVADWYEHKLYVLDAAAKGIVGEVSVGKSPSGIAVTPDGSLIVTADRDSNQVSIIDAATRTVLGVVPVGERPFGVTIDAGGQLAYTANVGSDDVSVVHLARRAVIATYPVGRRPYAVALAGRLAFVTDQYGGTVTVIDTETGTKRKVIEACDHPEGIAATRQGGEIYVACWMDNVLARIDTQTLTVSGKIAVGDGPRAFGAFLAEP